MVYGSPLELVRLAVSALSFATCDINLSIVTFIRRRFGFVDTRQLREFAYNCDGGVPNEQGVGRVVAGLEGSIAL
jgi:hypothetical protein